MDTIKTFFNNSQKESADDREPYTSTSAQDSSSSNASNTMSTQNSSTTKSDSTGIQSKDSATGTETYDSDVQVLSPVVHEHHHKKIIDENQTIIDRDHNVDHYKKKIQPVKVDQTHGAVDSTGSTVSEERNVDHQNKDKLNQKLAAQKQPQDSHDEEVTHETIQKQDQVRDKTHHHVHESVQPVIEKDVYDTEIKHNKKLVHEEVQEQGVVEETEVLPTQTQKGDLAHSKTKPSSKK